MKIVSLKMATVLVPSYSAAFVTGQMVYVVPTVAAFSFLAAAIEGRQTSTFTDSDMHSGTEVGNITGE